MLSELVANHRVLICVGSGGVGKTTVSAALALWAAREGARALVLTVDPARRLASALGLESFTEEERVIDDATLDRAGIRLKGRLTAAMLDTKSTFDRVIGRYATTPELRDRILASPFYRQASTALPGSQEYMAMEKLYEIREERARDFDLVVLDTPPSHHALDFLTAPARMQGLFDSRAFRTFSRTLTTLGKGRFGLGRNNLVLRGMGRFLGAETFLAILSFLDSLSSMYEGFSARSRAVEALLKSRDVCFLIVTSPNPVAVSEALYLHDTLLQHGMPFGAFIVNRVHLPFARLAGAADGGSDVAAVVARFSAGLETEPSLGLIDPESRRRLAHKAAQHAADLHLLAARDHAATAVLRDRVGALRVLRVPRLPHDVHDLADLHHYGRALFAAAENGPAKPEPSPPPDPAVA